MANDVLQITDEERYELLRWIVQEEDKDALHEWLVLNMNVDIPKNKVCHDHQPPFDFVADYIFNKFKLAVVLGNRSGGKTNNFAVLDTVMSYYYKNAETATVGAIQAQAQRCYNYFVDYTSMYPFNTHVENQSMKRTDFDNGSSVEIVTGTVAGVNSPHPQFLFIDEIDLMLWFVLQQAFGMPQSKEGIDSRIVLTSTRKYAGGVMQRMIDDAKENDYPIYQWCIWDVIEKLPEDKDKREQIIDVFGAELPDEIENADGFFSWDDAILKYNNVDQDVWETEYLCLKPGTQGLVYGSAFNEDENIIKDFSPEGEDGYIYLFEDFGFGEGHPDVVLFNYVPPEFDRLITFDELYLTGMLFDDIEQEIKSKLAEYNLTTDDIRGWIPDPAGLTEIEERRRKGYPIMKKVERKHIYRIREGIPIVKKFLRAGRWLIADRCQNLRFEIMSYKKKRKLDGTWSEDPKKENDHGPDAARYGFIRLADLLESNWMREQKLKENASKPPQTKKKRLKEPRDRSQAPATAGILDKRF